MKRLSSDTERELPLKRFRRSVNNVISSLGVIKKLNNFDIDTDRTELAVLDIIRHGERTGESIELLHNTHVINISITPLECMMFYKKIFLRFFRTINR
jgi:hypothetical protein